MFKQREIKVVFIICIFFLLSCAGSGLKFSGEKETVSVESRTASNSKTIIWEPEPRPVAKGNDAQLLVRTSESMNLLYAAHNEKGKQNLFMSKTKNIGDSFSNPIIVNSGKDEVSAHGENGPKLKQGKGRGIFAAWIGKRDIKFARSMNFGKSFGPALRINDDEGKASQSFFAMDVSPDGYVFLAWLDSRDKKQSKPGTSSIYIARSINKGKSFERNIKISGDVCPCCRAALAFGNNGEIFASWRHVYEDNERIMVVATSLDGGENWGDPVKVSKTGWKINGCAHSGSTMKYIGGKLFISWYTGKNDKAALKLAYSSDNGKSFELANDIHGQTLDANHPDMVEIANEAWIIFQGRDPNKGGGWGRDKAWLVRISGNNNISKPSPLPSTGASVAYPYLFKGNGGRVYAMWTEIGEKGPLVMLCRGRIQS
jgi:hypothetical protein